MNNDLIKRIDESFFFVVDADGQQRLDKLLADCRAEIKRKPYVPMTDDDFQRLSSDWEGDDGSENCWERHIEVAVIKRAGLEIKHD